MSVREQRRQLRIKQEKELIRRRKILGYKNKDLEEEKK